MLSLITAALLESEGTVKEAICDVGDRFPGEASSDTPGTLAEGLPIRLTSRLLYDLFFC